MQHEANSTSTWTKPNLGLALAFPILIFLAATRAEDPGPHLFQVLPWVWLFALLRAIHAGLRDTVAPSWEGAAWTIVLSSIGCLLVWPALLALAAFQTAHFSFRAFLAPAGGLCLLGVAAVLLIGASWAAPRAKE